MSWAKANAERYKVTHDDKRKDFWKGENNAELKSSAMQMDFQEAMMQRQMDYQTEMSNTAVQRGVKDMTAAGINPMVAMSSGANVAASAPSGAGPSGGVRPGTGPSGFLISASERLTSAFLTRMTNFIDGSSAKELLRMLK